MDNVKIEVKRVFPDLSKYIYKVKDGVDLGIFEKYGRMGVEALENATPKDSGYTAGCWFYRITVRGSTVRLSFHNSHVEQKHNIAILLQIGHGTRNGGWVEGRDYINPATRPVFEAMVKDIRKEVIKKK